MIRNRCDFPYDETFSTSVRGVATDVQRQARAAYRRFVDNPRHPGLHFKQVHSREPIYSVRINIDYRAVGVRAGDQVIWFWIGTHAEYDRLLNTR